MKTYVTVNIIFLLVSIESCLSCTNSSLRLQSNGTLQICTEKRWKAVCNQDWGNVDTAVACRQLGYDGGFMYGRAYITPVDGRIYHCNGTEKTLSNCVSRNYTWCRQGVNITCIRRNESDLCNSGDIRLWGGNTTYEGNIELCTDHKVWSAISDSSWYNPEAVVACRQLGYSNSIALPTRGSKFGQRYQPMEFGGFGCRGTEHDLKNCTISTSFVNTWSGHIFSNTRDYAGVRCLPKSNATCSSGDVRLTGGYSSNNGIVEICIDGFWAGMCDSSDAQIASHICAELNYSRSNKIDNNFFQLYEGKPLAYIYLDSYRCRYQSESVLLDCVRNSTTYGIVYVARCSSYGILCCPNDSCTIQPPKSTSPTILSPMPNPTVILPTTSPSESMDKQDQREYSLHFDTMAASLVYSDTVDLRGLEKDIKTKLYKCMSDKYDHFTSSALEDGVFYFDDEMLYKGKFSPLSDISADALILQLMKCIKKEPWIEYYNTDLRLHVTFGY